MLAGKAASQGKGMNCNRQGFQGRPSKEMTSASGEQPCKEGEESPSKEEQTERHGTRKVWQSRTSRDSVATAELVGQK